MAFPGPNATVYYNDAGEPLGWSDESSYEPDPYDDDTAYGSARVGAAEAAAEESYQDGTYDAENENAYGETFGYSRTKDSRVLSGLWSAYREGWVDGGGDPEAVER